MSNIKKNIKSLDNMRAVLYIIVEENTMKTECPYCKSQQLPDGTWISKDAVYAPRFPQSKDISHCPCPECFEKAMKEINNL